MRGFQKHICVSLWLVANVISCFGEEECILRQAGVDGSAGNAFSVYSQSNAHNCVYLSQIGPGISPNLHLLLTEQNNFHVKAISFYRFWGLSNIALRVKLQHYLDGDLSGWPIYYEDEIAIDEQTNPSLYNIQYPIIGKSLLLFNVSYGHGSQCLCVKLMGCTSDLSFRIVSSTPDNLIKGQGQPDSERNGDSDPPSVRFNPRGLGYIMMLPYTQEFFEIEFEYLFEIIAICVRGSNKDSLPVLQEFTVSYTFANGIWFFYHGKNSQPLVFYGPTGRNMTSYAYLQRHIFARAFRLYPVWPKTSFGFALELIGGIAGCTAPLHHLLNGEISNRSTDAYSQFFVTKKKTLEFKERVNISSIILNIPGRLNSSLYSLVVSLDEFLFTNYQMHKKFFKTGTVMELSEPILADKLHIEMKAYQGRIFQVELRGCLPACTKTLGIGMRVPINASSELDYLHNQGRFRLFSSPSNGWAPAKIPSTASKEFIEVDFKGMVQITHLIVRAGVLNYDFYLLISDGYGFPNNLKWTTYNENAAKYRVFSIKSRGIFTVRQLVIRSTLILRLMRITLKEDQAIQLGIQMEAYGCELSCFSAFGIQERKDMVSILDNQMTTNCGSQTTRARLWTTSSTFYFTSWYPLINCYFQVNFNYLTTVTGFAFRSVYSTAMVKRFTLMFTFTDSAWMPYKEDIQVAKKVIINKSYGNNAALVILKELIVAKSIRLYGKQAVSTPYFTFEVYGCQNDFMGSLSTRFSSLAAEQNYLFPSSGNAEDLGMSSLLPWIPIEHDIESYVHLNLSKAFQFIAIALKFPKKNCRVTTLDIHFLFKNVSAGKQVVYETAQEQGRYKIHYFGLSILATDVYLYIKRFHGSKCLQFEFFGGNFPTGSVNFTCPEKVSAGEEFQVHVDLRPVAEANHYTISVFCRKTMVIPCSPKRVHGHFTYKSGTSRAKVHHHIFERRQGLTVTDYLQFELQYNVAAQELNKNLDLYRVIITMQAEDGYFLQKESHGKVEIRVQMHPDVFFSTNQSLSIQRATNASSRLLELVNLVNPFPKAIVGVGNEVYLQFKLNHENGTNSSSYYYQVKIQTTPGVAITKILGGMNTKNFQGYIVTKETPLHYHFMINRVGILDALELTVLLRAEAHTTNGHYPSQRSVLIERTWCTNVDCNDLQQRMDTFYLKTFRGASYILELGTKVLTLYNNSLTLAAQVSNNSLVQIKADANNTITLHIQNQSNNFVPIQQEHLIGERTVSPQDEPSLFELNGHQGCKSSAYYLDKVAQESKHKYFLAHDQAHGIMPKKMNQMKKNCSDGIKFHLGKYGQVPRSETSYRSYLTLQTNQTLFICIYSPEKLRSWKQSCYFRSFNSKNTWRALSLVFRNVLAYDNRTETLYGESRMKSLYVAKQWRTGQVHFLPHQQWSTISSSPTLTRSKIALSKNVTFGQFTLDDFSVRRDTQRILLYGCCSHF